MKTCEHCGKTYEPQRSSSKYCSDNCRVKANREEKRATRLNLDKNKVERMVTLLKVKIDRFSGDIDVMKQNSQIVTTDEAKRAYRDMIREKTDILSELNALWECLE